MFVAPISTDATAPKGTLGDPNDPTILVYPHVVYNGLNAISMLEQTFETDLQLELTWIDASIGERLSQGEKWNELRNKMWHPGIRLDNCAEEKNKECWFRLLNEEAGLVSFVVRMRGIFRERFELKRFPFDNQWLTVRFTSCWAEVRFTGDWPDAFKDILATPPHEDFVNLNGFILEEWQCFPAACVQGRLTKPAKSASGTCYHELNCKLMIRRESGYYMVCGRHFKLPTMNARVICVPANESPRKTHPRSCSLHDMQWNIAMIDFLLVCSSLTVLLVPAEDFADRMAMSLTLLLTAVAFKQVVSTHLPSISYLTTLDKYVLCGFLMQVLVVAQNAIAKYEVDNYGTAWFSDYWGGVSLLLYLLAYQAVFGYEMYRCKMVKGTEMYIKRFITEAGSHGHRRWHRVHFSDSQFGPFAKDAKEAEEAVLKCYMEPSERKPKVVRFEAASANGGGDDDDDDDESMDFEYQREQKEEARKWQKSPSRSILNRATSAATQLIAFSPASAASVGEYQTLGVDTANSDDGATQLFGSPDPQLLASRGNVGGGWLRDPSGKQLNA